MTAANGADPAQPRRTLTLPTPQVLNSVLKTWRRDRKPANVELVLDNSGSMADEDKLAARQGRARRVLQAGRAAGRDRPGEVLRRGHAAGRARAVPREQGHAHSRRSTTSSPRTTRRSTTRWSTASTRSRSAPTPSTSTPSWCSPTARTRTPRTPAAAPWLASSRRASQNPAACACSPSPTAATPTRSELSEFADGLGRQGLQGLHRRHRGGLPLDLLVLLSQDARHPRRAAAPARGQRRDQAAEHRRARRGDRRRPAAGRAGGGAADRGGRLHRAVPADLLRRRGGGEGRQGGLRRAA